MTIPFDGQLVTPKRIIVRNAFNALVYLEKYATAGNDLAAWTSAPSVAVAFTTDRQGNTVITDLGPFSMTEVDATNYPGWYYYIVPASVTALLDTDTYRGTTVFMRITAGSAAEVKRVYPLIVTEPGFAGSA
jgi:hypothetical protein